MLTFNEVIELRDKLANGKIDLASAQEKYWKDFKDGQKSWQTKDWKERRAEIIKDKCEICGSKETLTLQHRSHPKKYAEYLSEVTSVHVQQHISTAPVIDKTEFSNYVSDRYDYVPVPLCPNCKRGGPAKRVKKLPPYHCTGCKHEFDSPDYNSAEKLISIFFENEDAIEVRDKCFVSKDKWRNQNNLSNIRYWLLRERAKDKNSEVIEKEAFLRYLDDSLHYLSFADTITACRKCAYHYDIKKMNLCPNCNQFYKGIQYPTCIQCLPEDRRKAVMETIAFVKEMDAIHRDLGID